MAKVKIGNEEFSLQEIVDAMHKKFDEKFVDVCVLDELDKPENLAMARGHVMKYIASRICERSFMPMKGGHNCYWNDGFYIANRFDLDEHTKRRTAVVALWNGRHSYWEWETHNGFDMARLLGDMGVISRRAGEEFRVDGKPKKGYFVIPQEVHHRIREAFSLTREELMAAPLLCKCVWDKERTNNKGSGMFEGLNTAYVI